MRLKANYDTSQLTGQATIIARAPKKYGLILGDNGGNWFFGETPDPRWNDAELNQLKRTPGNIFEVVDTRPIIKNNSTRPRP